MKRYLLRLLTGLCAIAGLTITCVYAISSWKMHQQFPYQQRNFTLSAEADITEGKRLAIIRNCFDGCHGEGGRGNDFYGLPAPNLTKIAKTYSDDELERAIRQGVRPNGTGIYSMASESFQYLSDLDLSHIIVFFRSLPQSSDDPGDHNPSFAYRLAMVRGEVEPAANFITNIPPPKETPHADPLLLGQYLALSVCSECHGLGFQGEPGFSPNLIIVRAYQQEEFRTLLSTGLAKGNRQLGLMSEMGSKHYNHLTDIEVNSLYNFFQSEPFMALAQGSK